MMLFVVRPALRPAAGLAAALALALLATACGRRGALEAPPGAQAAQTQTDQQAPRTGRKPATPRVAAPPAPATFGSQTNAALDVPDDEAEDESPAQNVVTTPNPTPPGGRKRGRGYLVPKEPFILDPLL